MRLVTAAVSLVLLYLVYGVFLSHYDLRVIPAEMTSKDPDGFHDYLGVINVHSERSTGSGSISEIVKAAQEAGLDFIFVTDLNPYAADDKVFEGYHDNLLVFVDGMYSYLNSRLINLGVTAQRELQGPGRAQVYFADMLSQANRPAEHGMFILAHPLKPNYAWSGEYPSGLDGIEIINLKSLWQDGWRDNKLSSFWSLLVYPFNQRLALLRLFHDPQDEVRLWDELSRRHPTLGFTGADADARIRLMPSLDIKYPSYQSLFGLVRNHVLLSSELTGDAASDRQKILQGLKRGNFYVSLDILADPKGFSAKIVNAKGDTFAMGSQVPWSENLELWIHLPHKPDVPFETEIYKDGVRILLANAEDTRIPLHDKGVYRVKVRVIPTLPLPDGKKWIPWIFTNPFYVGTHS